MRFVADEIRGSRADDDREIIRELRDLFRSRDIVLIGKCGDPFPRKVFPGLLRKVMVERTVNFTHFIIGKNRRIAAETLCGFVFKNPVRIALAEDQIVPGNHAAAFVAGVDPQFPVINKKVGKCGIGYIKGIFGVYTGRVAKLAVRFPIENRIQTVRIIFGDLERMRRFHAPERRRFICPVCAPVCG